MFDAHLTHMDELATMSPRRRRRAQVHAQRLLAKVARAHKAGNSKAADHLTRKYLASLDARYIAVLKAYRKLHKRRRPLSANLITIAKELNAWSGTDEKVALSLKEKPNKPGHFRDIKSFGIKNRALQYLVLDVLRARADLHDFQFATRGVHAAIEHVADCLSQGYVWAIEMDIVDCYASFDGEKVKKLLPLPEEVIRNVILCDHLSMYLPLNSVVGPAKPEDDLCEEIAQTFAAARCGIPQGSAASAAVAEILLKPVLSSLPKDGVWTNYADNFLAMGKTEHEVATLALTFWRALKAHCIGHLRPNTPKIFQPGEPVDFLGHRFTMNGSDVIIEPTPMNLEKFSAELSSHLRSIREAKNPARRLELFRQARRFALSWASAFSCCNEIDKTASVALARIEAAHEH